jgi:hypothetical protein
MQHIPSLMSKFKLLALILVRNKSINKMTIDDNKWELIFDFTKDESGLKNFSLLNPSEFEIITKTVDGMD